jgi:hypothetical protein
MYTLDVVIKTFKKIIKDLPSDDIARNYYEIIVGFMLIENKHKDAVLKSGKPIYHYFMYKLPMSGRKYFNFLYDPYNPVRFSVETFSSVEEIKDDYNLFWIKRKK